MGKEYYYVKDGERAGNVIQLGEYTVINPSHQNYIDAGYEAVEIEVPNVEEEISNTEDEPTVEQRYEEMVEQSIRSVYSVSQELAILRQRDTKPDEFQTYFDYCEECKRVAKIELGMIEDDSSSGSDAVYGTAAVKAKINQGIKAGQELGLPIGSDGEWQVDLDEYRAQQEVDAEMERVKQELEAKRDEERAAKAIAVQEGLAEPEDDEEADAE